MQVSSINTCNRNCDKCIIISEKKMDRQYLSQNNEVKALQNYVQIVIILYKELRIDFRVLNMKFIG
jgi:hypothetical protein